MRQRKKYDEKILQPKPYAVGKYVWVTGLENDVGNIIHAIEGQRTNPEEMRQKSREYMLMKPKKYSF